MPNVLRPWRIATVGLAAAGLVAFSWSAAGADDPPKPPATPPAPEKPADLPKDGAKPTGDKPAEKPAEKPKLPISEAVLPGEPARDLVAKDVDGKVRKLSEFKGKWVVLEWTNYTCPFVQKHYAVTPAAEGKPAVPGRMATLQKAYTDKGVVWLSICSSAPGKPAADGQDPVPPKEGWLSPEKWKEALKERMAAPTAVLLDEDGKVGRAWGARRTPTVWILDPKGVVGYFGAVDDKAAPRANPAEAHNYVAEFLDAVLAGKEPPTKDTKPYG
jgi:peroxiredoxin